MHSETAMRRPLAPPEAGRRTRTLVFVMAAALVLKLCLALCTFGTNDALTFERMLDKLNKSGVKSLYLEGTVATLDGKFMQDVQMNHPPFVVTLLHAWRALRTATGLPLRFWIRAWCAFADLLTVWLLWKLSQRRGGDWRAVFVVAMAPAAIMISGFHGNTDPIMIALAVLAVYLLEVDGSAWLAGIAFGLGCSVKVWPLVLTPVLLFGAGTLKRRVQFSIAMAVTGFCAAMPWLAVDPALIIRRVFDYAPVRGWWGVSYLYPNGVDAARTAVFGCCLAASTYMHQRVRSIIAQCAIVTAIFLFLTPGFGPQYLAWLVPWTVAAGWRSAAIFHAAAGAYLFGVYNTWCLGLPWYFANAYNLHKRMFHPWVYCAAVILWTLMLLIVAVTWRRHRVALVAAPDDGGK